MMVKVQAFRDSKFTGDEKVYDLSRPDALVRFKVDHPQCNDCILVAETLDAWVEATYSPSADISIIIRYWRDRDGLLAREEVVGFYHGEPDEKATAFYADRGLVAELI